MLDHINLPAAAAPADLHAGLLALLPAILAASAFTLGMHADRSHASLHEAKRVIRERATVGGAPWHEDAANLVRDTQSWLLLLGNALLVAFTLWAALWARVEGMGREGELTVWLFCAAESTIVALALVDHLRVRTVIRTELAGVGKHVPARTPRQALTDELRGRRPAEK